jgi:hypothetical protein
MMMGRWRLPLLLAGVALFMGGPRHPSPDLELPFLESTAVMLAHSDWVPSHAWMLGAFALLFLGLALWQRQPGLPPGTRRWMRFSRLAVGLAVVEMAFHTAAVLDLGRLRAGSATPILSTHLLLAATVNPLMGIALAGVALHGARLHRLGSIWIAWMVVLGGAMFGLASTYVVVTHDQRVSPFFAIGSSLMALWFILAALWPVRGAPAAADDAQQSGVAAHT